VLPMMPGMPERRTHDYVRNGITSLFAAFNIADGTVITELRGRFLGQIVPDLKREAVRLTRSEAAG
jgi:hypothetical protein